MITQPKTELRPIGRSRIESYNLPSLPGILIDYLELEDGCVGAFEGPLPMRVEIQGKVENGSRMVNVYRSINIGILGMSQLPIQVYQLKLEGTYLNGKEVKPIEDRSIVRLIKESDLPRRVKEAMGLEKRV